MAVDDVYQLQLHGTYAGQQIMNSLHFRIKVATDPGDAQFTALASDFKDQWKTEQVPAFVYTTWIAQQVRGGSASYATRQCQRVGGRRLEGQYSGSLLGTGTGDGLPPQSAWVTTLKTDESGRSKRGRHYLCGISEGYQVNGTITAGFVTAYQTGWNSQITAYKAGGTDPTFELGIWSMRIATGCVPRKQPPYGMEFVGPVNPTEAFEPVTAVTCRSIINTQRRRTIGVGR